jgi:hypothetical protein
MIDRKNFLIKLSKSNPTKLDLVIALLWFYNSKQEYEERSVSDLVQDIEDDSFGRLNITKLRNGLRKSRWVVKGSRPDTFRINASRFSELSKKYGPIANLIEIEITSSVIPISFVRGKRTYLERIVQQINGSYDRGFYDACAVLVRRLMESLIIEIYFQQGRGQEIKTNNTVFTLNGLITKIESDSSINISRNLPKGMNLIKDLGDTAAHDRTYITQVEDIDDSKNQIRKTIYELLFLAGLTK